MGYFDSPCTGNNPATNDPWSYWRLKIFESNTGCKNGNCPPEADAPSGYYTTHIQGVNYGSRQPVTIRQLYSYSNPCKQMNTHAGAKNFCDNLRYANGDIVPPADRPFACGGNGPNISNYSIESFAYNEIKPEVDALVEKLAERAEKAAKQVKGIWVIALLTLLFLLFLRFF